jgi:hypothetical protein
MAGTTPTSGSAGRVVSPWFLTPSYRAANGTAAGSVSASLNLACRLGADVADAEVLAVFPLTSPTARRFGHMILMSYRLCPKILARPETLEVRSHVNDSGPSLISWHSTRQTGERTSALPTSRLYPPRVERRRAFSMRQTVAVARGGRSRLGGGVRSHEKLCVALLGVWCTRVWLFVGLGSLTGPTVGQGFAAPTISSVTGSVGVLGKRRVPGNLGRPSPPAAPPR